MQKANMYTDGLDLITYAPALPFEVGHRQHVPQCPPRLLKIGN